MGEKGYGLPWISNGLLKCLWSRFTDLGNSPKRKWLCISRKILEIIYM